MAANSRSNAADIGIALGVALLGAAAVAMPDMLLRVTPPCLISLVFDDVCWGCGITRALVALVHGNFAAAWAFNKAVFIVLPMLMYLYIKHLHTLWRRYTPLPKQS
ncbi:DUF2752 domain-containing protein [Massilia sp. CF038]|uniref:DUF2752 domain-containing protein n=1 Tax=Massilia sp. CF038 TaxID=1881045 RepID=UPI0009339B89|nr:DUF2752 domain-containing protein [Massilia sp. CF038]